MNKNGFTLLELLVTVAIFSISIFSLFLIIQAGINIWQTGHFDILNFKRINRSIPVLDAKLKSATEILNVSLSNNKQGYIQYLDINNQIITIYQNSTENRILFLDNDWSSSNIIICVSDQTTTTSPTILMNNIIEFSVETFKEDRNYFHITTINNTVEPVQCQEISSIRFKIKALKNNREYERNQLIHLPKYPMEKEGSVTYTFSNTTDFTLSNVKLFKDASSGLNGIIIVTPSYTIKIANTGEYFSSIQDAINHAQSGDKILVSQGEYEEYIILKSGVYLYGGYENYTWTRDIQKYNTTIKTKIGIADTTISLADSSGIDGFTINGQNLTYGVYGSTIEDISIKNCKINDCDTPIYLNNATGEISNNQITGNASCLTWDNSTSGEIFRNRFSSNNYFGRANISFTNDINLNFRNNVVTKGSKGIDIDNSQQINIINNIVERIENIAVKGKKGCIIYFINNIVVNNNFGIYCPNTAIGVAYNYFCDNRFGNTGLNYPVLSVGNIIDNTSYDWNSTNIFTENPIYDIETYELRDGSPCIDKGNENTDYKDVYTDNKPCKGLSDNDMGAFGGPYAGRLGPGNTIEISVGDVIQTKIDSAFPSDFIKFTSGNFTAEHISLKKSLTIMGSGVDATKLSCPNGLYIFECEDSDTIENMALVGNNTNKGIQATGKDNLILNNLVLVSFDQPIYCNASTFNISNISCTGNNTAIKAEKSSYVEISNSIFADSILVAIQSDTSTVKSMHNLFYNNSTNILGTVDQHQSITGTLPLFFDPKEFNYYLNPSSNAINAGTTPSLDVGCLEYYCDVGRLDFPIQKSSFPRKYRTLSITLSDDSSTTMPDAFLSQIEIGYILNNSVPVTIAPSLSVLNNKKLNYQWDLGARIIGKNFKLRIALKAYKYLRTPFLKELTFAWK